jgi:hypothetical protein
VRQSKRLIETLAKRNRRRNFSVAAYGIPNNSSNFPLSQLYPKPHFCVQHINRIAIQILKMVSENEANAMSDPSAQHWNKMVWGYVSRIECVIPSLKNLDPLLRRPKQSIRQGKPSKASPSSPPLQNRNRALTLPLPKAKLLSLRRQLRTNAQQDSLFMVKFPIEIRYMIYDHVFRGENEDLVVHIFAPKTRRLAHSCWSPDQGVHVVFIPGKCENHTKDGFLSLLLTCRVM